jgi:hypothetical protein
VLVVLSVSLCLCAAAVAATAKVVRLVMDRFGLDPMTVMLWCGLAEWPSERSAPRRARADKSVPDRPKQLRRRSPHRSLGRLAARRP